MSDYATLAQNEKVEKIEFIHDGLALITLKSGFGNPEYTSSYHSKNPTYLAWCYDAAEKFVNNAEASVFAQTPGGKACRVADGTSWACNPHSETYWCT